MNINKLGSITIGRVNKPHPDCMNVRVDRQSVLGNPYILSATTSRDEVCDLYHSYLMSQAVTGNPLVCKALNEIYQYVVGGIDVQLNCHCAPLRCHAESIKTLVVNMVENATNEQGEIF
jgi:hypothetical protein